MIDGIVYDLDGTLLDTSGNITAAVNGTRSALGLEPISVERCMACIGDGARKLLERAVMSETEAPFEAVFAEFVERYVSDPFTGIEPYDGVMESLAFWQERGVPQAVLTNKPDRAAQPVIDALGLRPFLEVALGVAARPNDDAPIPPKPDPTGMRYVLGVMGVSAGTTWMVGDGPQDIRVAHASGTRCIAIAGGFGGEAEIRAVKPPPDFVVQTFREAFESLKTQA